MTKEELKRSHDAMARFLLALCKHSDTEFNGYRKPEIEDNYQKARRLLKRAGVNYQPTPRRPHASAE